MIQIKRLLSLTLALYLATSMMAQSNGCNSSYSRFGLGLPCDQSQGFNRAMGGVGQGLRSSTQLNFQNPASYSVIDSLTFIFDVGMKLQMGKLSGQGSSIKANNTSLEYVNAGFRIAKGLGMSLGFLPYTTIGYNFDTTNRIGSSYTSSQSITTRTTYYGNGGLHEMYLGLGWNPFADLSIGANIGYLWGSYNHSLAQVFYEGGSASSNYNTQNEQWTSDIKTYKLDIGIQYPIRIDKDNLLTIGASVGIGHGIKNDVELLRYTSLGDTVRTSLSNAFELPYSVAVGASWQKSKQLTVAVDYDFEKWQGCRVPISYTTATGSGIQIVNDQYENRHRISAGADYIRNPMPGGKYLDHIHFRAGASYTTPFLKVNGTNGPREYALSAGVGLPLKTSARSLINVSVQWLKRSPTVKGQISENYFMMHVGLTFNEQWFMKFKFK